MSQVTTSKPLDLNQLSTLLGSPVTLVSGVVGDTNPKTVSADVPQAQLQTAINEFTYESPAQEEQAAVENLRAFANRASNVINGTDVFTANDIQSILAWYLVAEHGSRG